MVGEKLWSLFDIIVAASALRQNTSHAEAVANTRMWLEHALDGRPSEKRAAYREDVMRPRAEEAHARKMIAEMQTVTLEHLSEELLRQEPTVRDWQRYATILNEQHCGSDTPLQDFSREGMWKLGRFLFDRTLAHADDPSSDDAWVQGMERARSEYSEDEFKRMWAVCNARNSNAIVTAAARWYEQGCPVVQLSSHSYAAALAATSLPKDIDVRPPWRSFMIDLPNDLIPSEGGGDVRSLLVHHHTLVPDRSWSWSIVLLPRTSPILLRSENRSSAYLIEGDLRDAGEADEGLRVSSDLDTTAEDHRKLVVAARIAFGTCLAMSDPTAVRTTTTSRLSISTQRKRLEREPLCRVFLLGRTVSVDVREAIHSYIAHGSKGRGPLTVQFLVRGHWRNQAHGPHMSERKIVWIEPHWKGPEDGPINLRPHVLKGEP
jgi:hypothetical protein